MNKIEIIGFIASLVSIISAIISVAMYFKNNGIKKQIEKTIDISAYTSLGQCIDETIKELKKIAFSKSPIRGVSIDSIIGVLKESYEYISYNKDELKRDGFVDVEEKLILLNNNIAILSLSSNKIAELIPRISEIYIEIININSEIIKIKKAKLLE